jgi:hypothetical protein
MAGIGVALSGGGHRATTWALGALMAMVDSRVNKQVVSISSVSGGSIANGIVAQRVPNFRTIDRSAFEDAVRPGVRHIAREGLIFFGRPTDWYVFWVFMAGALAIGALLGFLVAAITAGRQVQPLWWLLLGPVIAAIAWWRVLRSALTMGSRWKLLVVALLVFFPSGLAWLGAWLTRGASGWSLAWKLGLAALVVVAAFAILFWVFSQRSQVVDDALAKVHYQDRGSPTLLSGLADRPVHHVFCATELQAGDHMYFSPKLVYSYRVGVGMPGPMRLSTAVQVSACLPGGFVPRRLETAGYELERRWSIEDQQPPSPPAEIVVNDGGVYDNMADQWEQGFDRRIERIPHLREIQEAADFLVVVNAGKSFGWQELKKTWSLPREISGLSRSMDVQYDVSTSHRRQALVRRFMTSAAVGSGLRGALVHIGQSPFDIPNAYLREGEGDAQQNARAQEAMDFLAAIGADEGAWDERARENPKVATTLRALGRTTADLLEHAYLLTTVNLYVILGMGTLSPDPDRFGRPRFEALCATPPP